MGGGCEIRCRGQSSVVAATVLVGPGVQMGERFVHRLDKVDEKASGLTGREVGCLVCRVMNYHEHKRNLQLNAILCPAWGIGDTDKQPEQKQ